MLYEPPTIYGVIGNPLTHSLSPLMHNAAFKKLDVNAVYKLFPLADDEELKLFMEDLKEDGNPIFGLNVTVPFKEKVLGFVDMLDPFAEKVGAVNTLVITHQRKIHGFNTDGPGFLSHLKELKFDPKDKRIAIIGAGGTTRALLAVFCLINERPQHIRLYNRTVATSKALIHELGQKMDCSQIDVVDNIDDLDIEIADLLINTTSAGLNPSDPLLVPPEMLHSNLMVYDVIYNPSPTKLLQAAKDKGCKVANGLGMLFYQGVLAFDHWAGMDVGDDVKKSMRQALEKGLKNGPVH